MIAVEHASSKLHAIRPQLSMRVANIPRLRALVLTPIYGKAIGRSWKYCCASAKPTTLPSSLTATHDFPLIRHCTITVQILSILSCVSSNTGISGATSSRTAKMSVSSSRRYTIINPIRYLRHRSTGRRGSHRLECWGPLLQLFRHLSKKANALAPRPVPLLLAAAGTRV